MNKIKSLSLIVPLLIAVCFFITGCELAEANPVLQEASQPTDHPIAANNARTPLAFDGGQQQTIQPFVTDQVPFYVVAFNALPKTDPLHADYQHNLCAATYADQIRLARKVAELQNRPKSDAEARYLAALYAALRDDDAVQYQANCT